MGGGLGGAGPLIGTRLMVGIGIDGVLYLMAGAALLLALLAAARSLMRAPPAHRERTFEVLEPLTAPLAHNPDEPPFAVPDAADVRAAMRSRAPGH